MSRENYYILLELQFSPPENDANTIKNAINKKQAEWSKLRNHPSKGRQAQHYLDILPDIKSVMSDEDRRREEAKQAKIISSQKEKEKFKELDEAIRLLSTKKQITEEELKKLSQKFSIAEDAIRKRIKVPIVKSKTKKKTAERLDASIQKKISDSLKIVGKKSLYDFLQLPATSSLNSLNSQAKGKDTELKKDSNKDAILTASLELIGHCLNVFKTEDMRNRYDASLAFQHLDELNKAIDIAGMDGVIEVEEFDSLMKKAMGMGLKFEEAEEHIVEYCMKKKWRVKTPTRPSVEDMKQCGVCGLMNTSDAKNCVACGYPLEVVCPKCKNTGSSTDINCCKCGFPIGDMPNAPPLVKEAKEAKAGGDIKKAADLSRKALLFWPGNPEALAILQEIETRETEISQLAQQLNEQVNQKKYYSARQVLFKLKHLENTHPLLSVESKIDAQISAAESLVKKAKTAAKGDDALDFFSLALLECKDCREAVEGMAKYPPEPPQNLRAVPSSRSISLQWERSSSRGAISYLIVRKSQSPPLNAHDGEGLGETTQTLFDEADAVPGVIYYYGIYARRGDVFSQSGTIAGPVLRTAEIEDLTLTPGDSIINLNWKAPDNAKEILVCMKPGGIPSAKNDGRCLEGVREDGVVAAGLTNSQLYGFFILAAFTNEKGSLVYSSGTTCQCRPVAPPDPIKNITAAKKGNLIHVNWTPPRRGTVQIFFSRQPFAFAAGDMIPVAKLSAIGTQIPVQHAGNVQVPVNFQGVIHLLPVTVEGGIAVAGKTTAATSIDEISHLKGYINSGKLYVEWEWPTGAQKVLIAYNHQGFVSRPDESNAVKKTFSRLEYLRNSAFIIRSVEPKDYYFTVFVAAGEGEETMYSTGKQCLVANSGHMELYYEIHLSKNFVGKVKSAQLKLFSKEKTFKIPKSLLIKKNQNLPLRKSDGIQILEIGPMDIGRVPVSIEIPAGETGKGVFVKLFFNDDAQHQKYRVMSPSKNKLQLG